MELTSIVLTILVTLIYAIWKRCKRAKYSKNPPGPFSIPFIGSWVLLTENQPSALSKLRKRYGDIFSLRFGSHPIVVLNTVSHLRKVYSKKTVSGRPDFKDIPSYQEGKTYGITFNSGSNWAEQRNFYVKMLGEDLNFLTSRSNTLVNQGIQQFIGCITVGKPVDVMETYASFSNNTLWSLLMGKDQPYQSEKFDQFIELQGRMLSTTDALAAALYIPSFKQLFPWFFLDVSIKSRMSRHHEMLKSFQAELELSMEEQRQRSDTFVGSYLKKIEATTEPSSSFFGQTGTKNLLFAIFDTFAGAKVAVHSLFSWLCLLLSLHSETQMKLIAEIKLHIGSDRLPNLDDKSRLPFAQAVILEVFRYGSISALGGARRTSEDVDLDGYTISSGTVIIANLYGMMHDPAIWRDPQVFRPERFLCSEGRLDSKMQELLVPFSTGRRSCPAERFVKDIAFLFATTVFQKFKVRLDPDFKLPKELHTFRFFVYPKQHKVIFDYVF